jgi:metal-responsive CopG/Arc/MetJ family transcriptional regulator
MMAKIISVSLLEDDLKNLNDLKKIIGVKGNSETIRASLNSLLRENESISKLKGKTNALLVIVYQNKKVVEELEKYDEIIVTRLHHHVREKCAEIFLLKGNAGLIKEMTNKFSKSKKVLSAKLVLL